MAIDVGALMKFMLKKEISDIHLKADACPAMRYHGMMYPASGTQKLSADDIKSVAYQLMNDAQRKEFEAEMELDIAYSLEGVSRFRVNIFRQKGTIGLTLRVVPVNIRPFETLNLPVAPLKKLAQESRGLILFSGITGAGKTTTMNSFVHHLNNNCQYRIITIEDPIEFYHADVKSTLIQREVGKDTKSFVAALKHVLRQDPDVIVIGEMRDHETMAAALNAAETGHLVLSTIHTMNSAQTVDRIVDAHPVHQHNQVRQQLANTLKGVIGQRLVMSKDRTCRYPATEILIVNSVIRRNLLEGKSAEVYKVIENGAYYGMHSFDQDLLRLFGEGKIDENTVIENSNNPEDVGLKLKNIAAGQQMADNPINQQFNG